VPPAVAIAGAAVVGAGATLVAGSKAAHAQKDAANAQIEEQRREYDQTRADQQPWMQTGQAALAKLAGMYGVTGGNGVVPNGDALKNDPYGGYTESPGYQFQRDQGVQAAERAAAASGRLASGGTQKAVARYVTGLAANDYDNYTARLAQLAGVGQNATNAVTAAGQNTANNITTALGNAGQARASSYANTGSAINGGINNLAAAYLYSKGGFGGLGYPNPVLSYAPASSFAADNAAMLPGTTASLNSAFNSQFGIP
jgi:hypothetical protein